MGLFSKPIKSMDDLFHHMLQDIYYAEQQIVKALPTMIGQATNRDLAAGLRAHLEETEKQIGRLIHKRFVLETPFERLQHFPRYLKAAGLRLDKMRAAGPPIGSPKDRVLE